MIEQTQTTARDVIARAMAHGAEPTAWGLQIADRVIDDLLSAPAPVRQELAALLNPWRPSPIRALSGKRLDDIAGLIERLRERARTARSENNATALGDAIHFEEAAAALSSLVTQPLPDEIAGLIERLCKAIDWCQEMSPPAEVPPELVMQDVIDALRALAQENARLDNLLNRQKARTEEEAELHGNALNDLDTANARIRELEAERDKLQTQVGMLSLHLTERIAEHDTIRAKTIEEIIVLLDQSKTWPDFDKAIRALAQTDEKK